MNGRGQGSGAWRGPKVTQRDRDQLNLAGGAGPVGSLHPQAPSLWEERQPFRRRGAVPPQSPGDPVYGSGRGRQMSTGAVLCAGEVWGAEWALDSTLGFQRRDDFESQLYSDHFLILGRPS